MFDIGFWELCLIATVALLVLGPESLPVAARTAGKWIGKIRSMVSNVKQEIDRELQLDEIRQKMEQQEQTLREQSGIDDFKSAVDQTIADINPLEQTIHPQSTADDTQKQSESENDSALESNQDDKAKN